MSDSPLHLGKFRVHGQKGVLEIYRQLKGTCFNEYHSLFTLCAFLGYRSGVARNSSRSREPLFWSDTFTQYEYAAFYSLFIKTAKDNDYSLLKDGQRALLVLQDYADIGMDIFLQSDIMKKHVVEIDGRRSLDFSAGDYLPKQIMYYIYNESTNLNLQKAI